MPKPSSAEIHRKYMSSQALVCDQPSEEHGPHDTHDSFDQAQQDVDINSASGPASGLDPPDALTTPTTTATLRQPLDTPSETSDTPPVSALISSQSGSSSSIPRLSSFSSTSFAYSSDSSSFISDDDSFFVEEPVYTPKEAKEISIQIDGYCAVTRREAGWEDEDDDCPEGMFLEGYRKGYPIYYVTTGMDQKIKNNYTRTIIGSQVIQRPIDTCLGSGRAPADGTPPPNRTFANELIVIGRSNLKGYGVFAAVDIEQYTHILVEQPFFVIKNLLHLDSQYARLNEEEKVVFDGLVGYHKTHTDPVFQRYSANHFELAHGQGVFAIASNFNHACYSKRNTQYAWDQRRQVMTFTAMKDIKKGEEILISYCNNRRMLYSLYGFVCHCGGCENQEHEEDMSMQY